MSSPRAEFLAGMKATIPLVIGAVPFGIIFGALAITSGVSVLGTMALSIFVFAGSAQFIGVGLVAAGASIPVIVLTTFVVNLRHALYSATLAPYVRHLRQRWLLPLAYFLTDESFVIASTHYAQPGDLTHKQVIPEYFNWNGSRAGELAASGSGDIAKITEFIETHATRWPHDRVAIVGNSWGGHTAWEVINQLHERRPQLKIELAVFLDGSSTGRAPLDRKAVPINVNRSLNIYTRNSFVWGKVPASPHLQNIDLGDPTQGFLRRPGPAYDSTLNFKAHVSAEWDEEIHAMIRKRVVALITADQKSPHPESTHPESLRAGTHAGASSK